MVLPGLVSYFRSTLWAGTTSSFDAPSHRRCFPPLQGSPGRIDVRQTCLGCRGCSVMWLHVVVLCRSFTCSQMFPGLCVVTNVTNCTLPALNASPPSRCDESTFTFSGLNTLSPPILLPNTRHDVSTAAQWVEDVVDVAQTRGMS